MVLISHVKTVTDVEKKISTCADFQVFIGTIMLFIWSVEVEFAGFVIRSPVVVCTSTLQGNFVRAII